MISSFSAIHYILKNLLVLVLLGAGTVLAQISISSTVPLSAMNVCTNESFNFTVTLSNGSNPSINNTLAITLPAGMHLNGNAVYLSGGSGNLPNVGTNESPNLNVVDIPAFGSVQISFLLSADCSTIQNASNANSFNFSGSVGTATHTSTNYNVQYADLNIISVTNQAYIGAYGDRYVRTVTISNGGDGKISSFSLNVDNGNGLRVLGISGGTASGLPATDALVLVSNFSAVGNFDAYLDKNEQVVIRDTVQIVDCNNLSTNYTASYGCYSLQCNLPTTLMGTASAGANINSSLIPALSISYTQTPTPYACRGVNSPYSYRAVLKNTGTGPARNVEFVLSSVSVTGNDFSTYFRNVRVNGSLKPTDSLQQMPIANSQGYGGFMVGNAYCFASLPSDAFRVGAYRKSFLAAGDSIVVEYDTYYCSNLQNLCTSSFFYYPRVIAYGYNQCLSAIFTGNGYTHYAPLLNSFDIRQPAYILDGESKSFCMDINSLAYPAIFQAGANGFYEFRVNLPAGMSFSGNSSDLSFININNVAATPMAGYPTQVGNTVIIRYSIPALLGLGGFGSNSNNTANIFASFCINLSAIPNVGCGNANISYNLFIDPNLSCPDAQQVSVICGNQNVNHVCIASSPCVNGGLTATYFHAIRKNLGEGDSNNDDYPNGALDLNRIRRDYLMQNDTISVSFKSVVQNPMSRTDFLYGYLNLSIDGGVSADINPQGLANVSLKDASSGNTYTCTFPISFSNVSATMRKITVDFSGITQGACANPNLYLDAGDSILVNFLLVMQGNPTSPLYAQRIETDAYISNVANPAISDQYKCGANLLQNLIYTSYTSTIAPYGFLPGGSNYLLRKMCDDYFFSYYLSYYSTPKFPFEVRKVRTLQNISINYPSTNAQFQRISISSTNTNTGGAYSNSANNLAATSTSANTISLNTDSYLRPNGSLMYASDNNQFAFYAYYKDICPSAIGTNDSIFLTLQSLNHYTGLVETVNVKSKLNTTNLGDLGFSTSTPTINTLNNTVEWIVQISNPYADKDAPNVWIGEDALSVNGSIIQNVERLSSCGGSPVSSISQVGGVYQLGTQVKNTSTCYRITADYSSCIKDSIDILMGYGCMAYPTSVATNTCYTKSLRLYVIPRDASISTALLQQPTLPVNLCEDFLYEIEATNTDLGNAYNLSFEMNIPSAGTKVVAGSSEIAFPSIANGGIYVALPDPSLSANTYTWTIPAANLQGQGVAPANTYSIRFLARADENNPCAFEPETVYSFQAKGTNPCGNNIASTPQISQPVHLVGSNPSPNNYKVSIVHPNWDLCNSDSLALVIHAINNGPANSATGEYLSISIPDDYSLNNLQMTNANNPSSSSSSGFNVYTVEMSAGISPSDTISLYAKMYLSGSASCLSNSLRIEAKSFFAFSSNCILPPLTLCNTQQHTGGDTSFVAITRSSLSLNSVSASSNALNAASENVSISLNYQNTSAIDFLGNFDTELYYDADASGTYSLGDVLLATQSNIANTLAGASENVNMNLIIPSSQICPLVIRIPEAPCHCSSAELPISSIPLANSTLSQTECANSSFSIGYAGTTGYAYTWSVAGLGQITQMSGTNISNPTISIPSGAVSGTYTYICDIDRGGCNASQTYNIDINCAFPIELLSFEGKWNQQDAKLFWTTGEEINASHFELERSFDAETFFKISSIPAQNSPSQYQFLDQNAGNIWQQKLYYRLKMIDIDGKYKYSQLVELLPKEYDFEAAIFPNPAQNEVFIHLNPNELSQKISITDAFGKQLYNNVFLTTTQVQQVRIDLSRWAKGIYFVQLENSSKEAVFKLTIE